MKRFLLAAFKITPFQATFIAILAALKYVLTFYKIIDIIEKPFVSFCLGAGVLFIFAISIKGFIENRGKSFEEWNSNPNKSTKEKLIAGFASWGVTIPSVLVGILWLYIITPTSLYMALALYAGIIIRNCITFFSVKEAQQTID